MAGRLIATTGIGSVPFVDAEAAVKHVFANYSLPFYPQLVQHPSLKGDRVLPSMVREILTDEMQTAVRAKDVAALKSLIGSATDGDAAAQIKRQIACAPFLDRVSTAKSLKLQLVGPHTAHALLAVDCWDWVERLSLAWLRLVREKSATIAMQLHWDDGLLATKGAAKEHERWRTFAKTVQSAGATLGLHCCAPADLDQLTALGQGKVLALDANVIDLGSPASLELLRAHAASGGRLVLGAFDTRLPKFDRARGQNVAGRFRSVPGLIAISGGCGTGLHGTDYELALARSLTETISIF